MYDIMRDLKVSFDCIDDFAIQSSTLEQLFLQFARESKNKKNNWSLIKTE